MYVVTVTFDIRPDRIEAFLRLMRVQAENSRNLEEGCHQFDIAFNAESPGRIFLYELYTDRAAFDLHLESAHYQRFAADTADMIITKAVTLYDTREGE